MGHPLPESMDDTVVLPAFDGDTSFDGAAPEAAPDAGPPVPARGGPPVLALAVLAALSLAAGVFCLAAVYLVPGALDAPSPNQADVPLPAWGPLLWMVSPVFLTVGFGIAAGLLFVRAHRVPVQASRLRGGLWALALVLLAGATIFLFAQNIFAEAILAMASESSAGRFRGGGSWRPEWPVLLPFAAPGLLTPGLAIVAGLLATVKRRRP
ncbi:hypothetical protein ACQCSX_16325 [Pseudarthrobacter sp. P1]|uniref:hypothetical protein n=1 Tax=Pseudarthrobacter sp. P1 TaxID=3418418 RepID=UPI003CF47FDF